MTVLVFFVIPIAYMKITTTKINTPETFMIKVHICFVFLFVDDKNTR